MFSLQSAFMTLLGDPNDLVQDAASKGIGIVYDNCSEEDREKMVTSLLDTILGGRKEVNKVCTINFIPVPFLSFTGAGTSRC